MERTLWELLENLESASTSGIALLCVSDWQIHELFWVSVLRERRTLEELGRERLVRSSKKINMFGILGNRRLILPVLTTTMWILDHWLLWVTIRKVQKIWRWIAFCWDDLWLQNRWCQIRSDAWTVAKCTRWLKRTIKWYGTDGQKNIFPIGLWERKGLMMTNVYWKLEIWFGWLKSRFHDMKTRWRVRWKCSPKLIVSFDLH